MKDFPDSTPIGIRCPHCGEHQQQPFGWLKTHATIACAKCGATIPLDHADLSKVLSQVPSVTASSAVTPTERKRTTISAGTAARIIAGCALVVGIFVLATLGNRQPHPQQAPAVAPVVAPYEPPIAAAPRYVPGPPVPICALPPENGIVISRSIAFPGPHRIEIENGTGGNALVKVRDATTGLTVLSFFVVRGETAMYDGLPDGSYRLQFSIGDLLAESCHSFIHTDAVDEYEEIKTLAMRYTGDWEFSTTLKATLQPVPGGSARTHAISLEEFNAP